MAAQLADWTVATKVDTLAALMVVYSVERTAALKAAWLVACLAADWVAQLVDGTVG